MFYHVSRFHCLLKFGATSTQQSELSFLPCWQSLIHTGECAHYRLTTYYTTPICEETFSTMYVRVIINVPCSPTARIWRNLDELFCHFRAFSAALVLKYVHSDPWYFLTRNTPARCALVSAHAEKSFQRSKCIHNDPGIQNEGGWMYTVLGVGFRMFLSS